MNNINPEELSFSCEEKLPDHDIEVFWLNVKQSILNFYSQHKLIQRPVEKWSNTLNLLQKDKKYKEIEHKIMQYLSLYSIDLLRLGNQYYINILMTNLKRWDKLTDKYKFFDKDDTDDNNKETNIALILLEIVYSLLKSATPLKDLFEDIELYIIYEDFTKLIEFSVSHNKPSILDKLIAYDYLNVISTLNTLYSVNIECLPCGKLCGKKLITKIKNCETL